MHDIEFPDYKIDELMDMGKDRRELAFIPNTLPDMMIQLAAEHAEEDARLLLLIMKNAGKIAEERSAKKVEENCKKKAKFHLPDNKKKVFCEDHACFSRKVRKCFYLGLKLLDEIKTLKEKVYIL